jgi:hypothetical protein
MPLIRAHHDFDGKFTQIPNEWLRDTRLSLKAIGLLAQIMSHTPGWKMSIRSLAKMNGTGIDTIKSAVAELENLNYLKRSTEQQRTEAGTFADFIWHTSDPFQNPVTVKPRHGETAHKEEQESKEEQLLENKQENKKEINKEKRTAHLIPEDWSPRPEDWSTMAEHFGWVDLKKQTYAFKDYWTSQPPSKAKKTDWDATWRNWIRRAAEYNKQEPPKARRIIRAED